MIIRFIFIMIPALIASGLTHLMFGSPALSVAAGAVMVLTGIDVTEPRPERGELRK